jgi:NADH:ubiquinone oxidoreductase subunit F (NADH-binding)
MNLSRQKSPRKPSLKEMIRNSVEADPQTIMDRDVMKAKWGIEYKPKSGRN